MDPYRGAPDEVVSGTPRDRGIVGDIIQQFADPLAFYRELVQNAIDAGTPSVDVLLTHDAGAQVVRVAVRDQGEGMTRDILENQLLVLFRSTKEQDDTKIGKFGIGFASVLAPQPNVVSVQSVRDGRRLTLHLYPDLNFQLFDGGPAQRNGTTVELEVPMASAAVADFARRSLDALVRWCRHAAVPIRFMAAGCNAGLDDVRVDRALVLEGAILEVSGKSGDGRTTAVVGVLGAATPYAGFFDHGLTLFESTEAFVGRLAFKVQDARLGHTLSRDNVLRDDAFERAVEFVRHLAARELPRAAAIALRGAAEAGERDRYRALLTALIEVDATPPADAWAVPLIEPVGERRSLAAADLEHTAFGARERSSLTAFLAAAGTPVVDLSGVEVHWLSGMLERFADRRILDVGSELTLVSPVTPSLSDLTLLDALHRLLDATHRAPSRIMLGEFEGALGADLMVSGTRRDADLQHVIGLEHARRSPFERLRRPPLVLNVKHPQIASARRRAVDDPVGPASLLARVLLLRFQLLDVERSEALLGHTLDLAAGVR